MLNRGVRIIGSRFDSSSAFGASDLLGLRPHGASFSIKTEGCERIRFAQDQLLQLREALVNMISNPVNSTVPIAAEVFKKAGTY